MTTKPSLAHWSKLVLFRFSEECILGSIIKLTRENIVAISLVGYTKLNRFVHYFNFL